MVEGALSGTVTFLFTDVEGSTSLWQKQPIDMSAALRRHDELVRDAVARFGGRVFSTAGDSFAAAFAGTVHAVEAAVTAQRALRAESWGAAPICVRMGLHAGEVEQRDDDFFGPVLNRGARIMAAAYGGQILVSASVRELAVEGLSSGCRFVDLGEHPLRSLDRPEHLFVVRGEGLSDEEGLRTEAAPGSSMPVPRTGFVGRDDELRRLGAEVGPGRMLTLTGPGGAGKTRTSIEVAHRTAGGFDGGVRWCDLSPLSDDDAVAGLLATSLGVAAEAALSPIESIVDALRAREVLLVVDNCEHVIEGASVSLGAVMDGCARVGVLATSREPLDIDGERVWPLRPLDVETDAVELLRERAMASGVALDAGGAQTAELRELCRRLDGMPLAIEMAAARLRSLTPMEIINRLDDRFRLLRGRRDDNPRQRTLLATLDWSYELLDADEQLLLDRLSVFSGSFDLAAVEAVCSDDRIDEVDAMDLVGQLVDKSLVMVERGRSGARYRLLETVRHYSAAHIDERSEGHEIRGRHLSHVITVMGRASSLYENHDYWTGKTLFEDDFDNLRAAMQWSIETGDVAACETLFGHAAWYLIAMVSMEAEDWAIAAMSMADAGPLAHGIAAFFAAIKGDYPTALDRATRGVELLDSPLQAGAEFVFGPLTGGMTGMDHPDRAQAAANALAAGRARAGAGEAYWAAALCATLVGQGRLEDAADAVVAVDVRSEDPNPLLAASMAYTAPFTAFTDGPAAGIELAEQAVALAEKGDLVWYASIAAAMGAAIAAATHLPPAPELLGASISRSRDSRIWFDVWPTVRTASTWFRSNGDHEAAEVVRGHLAAHRVGGSSRDLGDESDTAITALHQRGAAMHRDELVDYVLEHLTRAGHDHGPVPQTATH